MVIGNLDGSIILIKICFICHGNICRSPMAEYLLKYKVEELGIRDKFLIVSRATSYEEIGNDMHYGTKDILIKNNIPFNKHRATRLDSSDYIKYDYFICMDDNNIRNTLRIFGNDKDNKVIKLNEEDVKDPWYTGNFIETYNDINSGLDKLIKKFIKL